MLKCCTFKKKKYSYYFSYIDKDSLQILFQSHICVSCQNLGCKWCYPCAVEQRLVAPGRKSAEDVRSGCR